VHWEGLKWTYSLVSGVFHQPGVSFMSLVAPYTRLSPAAMATAKIDPDQGTYDQLKGRCVQDGVLFVDDAFPAIDKSIFFSHSVPTNVRWKRPKVRTSKFPRLECLPPLLVLLSLT